MARGVCAILLVAIMCLAPLSGCFGEDEDNSLKISDVSITPAMLTGGTFQG